MEKKKTLKSDFDEIKKTCVAELSCAILSLPINPCFPNQTNQKEYQSLTSAPKR